MQKKKFDFEQSFEFQTNVIQWYMCITGAESLFLGMHADVSNFIKILLIFTNIPLQWQQLALYCFLYSFLFFAPQFFQLLHILVQCSTYTATVRKDRFKTVLTFCKCKGMEKWLGASIQYGSLPFYACEILCDFVRSKLEWKYKQFNCYD